MMRWLLFGCVVLLVGCGGGGGPTLPVSGVVTLDGKPVAGATVLFFPEEVAEGGGSSGTAETGSDGKFVILGAKGKPGLVPGKYKVTVSKSSMKRSGSESDGVGAVVEGELKDDFPPIYSSPAQTVLSYTITGDGKAVEIQLDSKRKK